MDRQRIDDFLDTFVGFASGATTIALLSIADRTGLLAWLAANSGGTSVAIAEGADLDERYVREILSGLAASGVVEYDSDSAEFNFPDEHALFLASEMSPYFMGGWLDMIPSAMSQIDGVARATVHGGGVGFEDFGSGIIKGIDRGNAPSQRIFLTKKWLPAVDGLTASLESGIKVADVGCGAGTASLLMAQTFPNSEVVGYDVSDDSLAIARTRAEGIPNIRYENYGAEAIPLDSFGLITTFDVIHDLVAPLEGLVRIREALASDGVYLMMEPNASSDLVDNLSPRGALLYGVSVMHCMTQSLANGGEGLGASWGRELAEDYCRQAGFDSFTALDEISNKFSAFYDIRP